MPLSRPKPDCLNPPNGTVMSAVSNVLTQTDAGPDGPRRRWALLTSRVQIPAARPYGVSLAIAQRVGLVLELGHGQDRPEDLLARDPPVVRDAVEDRRRDEEAAGLLADPLAAGDDRAPSSRPSAT